MSEFEERYQPVKTLSVRKNHRVELVQDQKSGSIHVAKILDRKKADPIEMHQLRTEIEVLSALHDPHIPNIVDVFTDEQIVVLVETWIQGTGLDVLMKKRLVIWRYRSRWTLELFHLLKNLHDNRFLYVDLKPSNIMIRQNHVYLIDFNACVPIGSHEVYMASGSNLAPEYLDRSSKTSASDLYALGTLVSCFYKVGLMRLWIRKCRRNKPEKRFRSLERAKTWFFIFTSVQKGMLCLILLSLSVFLWPAFPHQNPLQVYLETKEPEAMTAAYQWTFQQQTGTRRQKSLAALSYWVGRDCFSQECFEEFDLALFLLDEALLSESPELIEYVLDRIPEDIQTELPSRVLLGKMMAQPESKPQEQEIEGLLEYLLAQDPGLDQAFQFYALEQTVLRHQMVLQASHRQMIDDLCLRWDEDLLQQEYDAFLDVACLHGEYVLFLKTKGIRDVDIPDSFVRCFENEPTFHEIAELNRRKT